MSTVEDLWNERLSVVWMMSGDDGDTAQWLATLLQRPPWMADGACRVADINMFFPERGGNTTPEAKEVCRPCIVRRECLSYALEDVSLTGVWGGTSQRQRVAMRRTNR
jgi:WhiB family redox-sensing transcriptional regulator